ncbi:MAG TPA: Cro/Cl family transcriptional regulator [Clostridiales bacterium]|nr:Cro/Cl family transcriptional regulator [Clostridiales bacterium]
MKIGQQIKFLRQQNMLTQEELADRCELSKGFISLLERDMTSPSIATLKDILEALGTDLASFFAEAEEEKVVFGDEDYAVKEDKELGNGICWLIPNAQKNEMEPIVVTLEPSGKTYPDNPHEGEEIGFVLEGTINIVIGNTKHIAKKGQSFFIKPDKPHFISNRSATRSAKILWISSPPSF